MQGGTPAVGGTLGNDTIVLSPADATGDAGGVRMLEGQRLDVGSLLLAKGFALVLCPGFTAVIGLALGLGLNALGAEGRGGSGLASGRSCGHGRTPRTG
jgi:hypothetical protein